MKFLFAFIHFWDIYIIQVSGLTIILLLGFVYATIIVINQGDWRSVLLHLLFLDLYFVLQNSGYLILWAYSGYWDLQLFPRWFVNWRHDDTGHTWWGFHLDWSVRRIKRETESIWYRPGINWSPDLIQAVSSCLLLYYRYSVCVMTTSPPEIRGACKFYWRSFSICTTI